MPRSSEPTPSLQHPPWFYRQWMMAGNPALFFDRLIQDFGDFVHYRGLFRFYLINDPALVKQVLMDTHKTFDKNTLIYNRFRNAFGDGLVVAEGERWRRQRRLMQPMFGPQTVRRFFDQMVHATQQMLDSWDGPAAAGRVFDVTPSMNRLTLEIAGRALFRDGFNDVADDICRWTEVINRYSAKPPMPISGKLWFPSPTNWRLKRVLREFAVFVDEMIQQRVARNDQDDLLGILMNTRDEDTRQPMSRGEITEEVLGMIIGGHETSSSALTWIWYELDRHPEIRQQLLAEISDVVGDERLSLEHLPRLVYTKMVVEETLRLHPPFWFENRNAMEDVELGGQRIPKGSMVVFSRYSLHRHPGYWIQPEQFAPDRFRPGGEENKRSTYACVPFGGGPRICIGIHFAMLELIVVVAMISRRFHLQVDTTDRHVMAAHLTMEPKYGLKVRAVAV